MSKQQLNSLKQHCEVAAQTILAGDDAQLAEIVVNLRQYLAAVWQRDVDDEESNKAAIRLLAAANFARDCLASQPLVEWLTGCINSPAREFLKYVASQQSLPDAGAIRSSGGKVGTSEHVAESTDHLFEHFLQEMDPGQRRRAGVFYTPRPIVRHIVSQVHRLLQFEFDLADGLADISAWEQCVENRYSNSPSIDIRGDQPFVQVLDPALGTGVFLVEVIDLIHRTLVSIWREQGVETDGIRSRWNQYVSINLLPRLSGVELMPAPCLLAALNITLKLVDTGYDFEEQCQLNLHLADSLAGPFSECDAYKQLPPEWQLSVRDAFAACQDSRPTIVIGNPPYAALSNSESPWIEQLIRGRLPGGNTTGSYYEVDGRPLNERKLWLHDDYVKFMRFGQWRIEEAGIGILGLVTNHGYLDNPTFRGMRQQLLDAFPSISLVDLHGNAKKKETSIDGRPDQNVFDVEQGITIGLFRKTPGQSDERRIAYADVWGTRKAKYDWLESETQSELQPGNVDEVTTSETLDPVAPFYFFVPRDHSLDSEYESGFPITEVIPVYSSAVVTARDSFVIAIERDELVNRIQQFRDLSIPDEVIRSRYFSNTRSRKYPPGDTRGWKLPEARRRVAADEHWETRIRKCLYRPFDERYIFWSDEMIDWPRHVVSRHLIDHDNLALIARRQMLPTQPCRYFWVADQLVLDGVIRSDNRGNETVFPLYRYEDERVSNLNPEFVKRLEQGLFLTWVVNGRVNLHSTFGPEDVLNYIYAMFHSSEYRERYANQLRVDFPRVFLPRDAELFQSLCQLGRKLVSNHLVGQQADCVTSEFVEPAERIVAAGYPKYGKQCVHINGSSWFGEVPQDVWDFHCGGHQVCRKWLKDRRGRSLSDNECAAYPQIVAAIRATLELTKRIDTVISNADGWQNAFSVAAR